jgi:hypothetical protein
MVPLLELGEWKDIKHRKERRRRLRRENGPEIRV